MLKKLTIALYVGIFGWIALPIVAFHSAEMVDRWIVLVPQQHREAFVYKRLFSIREPNSAKLVLMEAWRRDLELKRGRFGIKNFRPLVQLTMWEEPFSEPVGLYAAKLLISSGSCADIVRMAELHPKRTATISRLRELGPPVGGDNCPGL